VPEDSPSADSSWAPVPESSPGAAPPPPGGGAYAMNAPLVQSQGSVLPLAGFWIQFLGYLIDGILLGSSI
jgi:hypothetical protein